MAKNYKRAMAQRMLTKKEIEDGVSPFDGKAWKERKRIRHEKEIKKHEDAVKRKEDKKLIKK